jgi:hypothetical protein
MSIYDDDWGATVDIPHTVTRANQAPAKLIPIHDKNGTRYYPAEPTPQPVVATPAVDPYASHAGVMNEVKTIYHTDPVSRGKALFLKTLGISLFLWGLTVAALALMENVSFFLWLFWASIEGGVCFIVLAYLDWREHPMSVRTMLAQEFLGMMRREQTMRHVAQYGPDLVRQAREFDA